MANSLAFFDAMTGVNYNSLASTNFRVGIVDPDSSGLTSSQLSSLESAGKTVIGYLSVGEAETYRSYWQSSWESNPPSWILGQNPDWGSYHVKFWDPAWQKIVIDRAVSMAKDGYDGIMMDVVDIYGVSEVAAADGGIDNARADMMKFVEAISAATKAVNPDFKIIQNNAMDLFATNPDDASSSTNTSYLSHIDGALCESTFYGADNQPVSWSEGNQAYLKHAVDAGKTVLAIDYPSDEATQQAFISKAIAAGYVPYVTDQGLSNNIDSTNYTVLDKLPGDALASILSDGSTSTADNTGSGTSTDEPATSGETSTVDSGSETDANPGSSTDSETNTADSGTSASGETETNSGSNTGSETITADSGTSASGETETNTGSETNTSTADSGCSGTNPGSTSDSETATTYTETDIPNGRHTVYGNTEYAKFDVHADFYGKATIKYFGADVHDVIAFDDTLFSSVAEVMENITYRNGDAIIHLPDGHSTIKVAHAGTDSMTAAEFMII